MSNYLITEEEINKILLSSPMILPTNPSGAGLKGDYIKELFYKHIRLLAKAINEHLSMLDNKTKNDGSAHNLDTGAHPYLINEISGLKERDSQLGNQIAEKIKEHNESAQAHTDIRESLSARLREHDLSSSSHKDLRGMIATNAEVAQLAYDTALGRARIIPVRDVFDMINNMSPNLSVGDRFILAEENVPDFTVFERNTSDKEAIEISQMSALMGLELLPGKKYVCNGFLLVASESGIDTSLFAKAEDLSALEDALNDKAENFLVAEILQELESKEARLISRVESDEEITLCKDVKHRLGLRTNVTLTVPSQMDDSFYSVVTFRSGTVPTEVTVNGELVFSQDDTLKGELMPVSNRIYELYIRVVEGILIANVCSTDYEVLA